MKLNFKTLPPSLLPIFTFIDKCMPALTLNVTGGIRYRVHAIWIEYAIFTYTCTTFLRATAIKTECMFVCFLPLLFAKCVDVRNLCLPRLWLYTLLQLTGPESRFLLASTPLLQPVLVSLIPDGRVSDKCTRSKGEESSNVCWTYTRKGTVSTTSLFILV